MDDFVIDTLGGTTIESNGNKVEDQRSSFHKLLFGDFDEMLKVKFGDKASKLNEQNITTNVIQVKAGTTEVAKKKNEVKKALEKSVLLSADFEKCHAVPMISEKNVRKHRKIEQAKTKGKKWYGIPATEMTEEVKHDLEVLQMRSVLDPKHFYKKNDLKVLPKYFQIGKVMDSPLDFYNNRLTKKARRKTLVDEILSDAEFNKYNKRKYKEIITEKQKTHYKAWRQAKKLKKKKI